MSYVSGEPPEGTSLAGDGRDDPIVYQFPLDSDPHRNLAASAADGIGDVEAGFAEADLVIERTYKADRVQRTPIAPDVLYATLDAGRLVLRASTQVPWHVRRIVASAIGIPENKIRVIKERSGEASGPSRTSSSRMSRAISDGRPDDRFLPLRPRRGIHRLENAPRDGDHA